MRNLLVKEMRLSASVLSYIFIAFAVIGVAEALWHIPGFEQLNAFGLDGLPLQLGLLAAGVLCYIALTALAQRSSVESFEKTDL